MKLNVNLCLAVGAIVFGVSGQAQAKDGDHNSVDVTRDTVSGDSAARKAMDPHGSSQSSTKEGSDLERQAHSHSDNASSPIKRDVSAE